MEDEPATGAYNALRGVTATRSDDVWAVGGSPLGACPPADCYCTEPLLIGPTSRAHRSEPVPRGGRQRSGGWRNVLVEAKNI